MKIKLPMWMLAAIMIFSTLFCTLELDETARAAKKPQISKKSITLTEGKSQKLTVKRSKNYSLSWKTSNKSVATVNQKGKVKAKKKGKTKVTAILKNKQGKKAYELVCTVKVLAKKGKVTDSEKDTETKVPTSGAVTIQVTDVKVTENSITLQTNWKNAAPYEICFGLDFKIERLDGEAWKEIQTDEPIIIPAIACVIKPGGEGPQKYYCPKITGGVKAGTYRLVVNASHRDTQDSAGTESWKSVTETLYGNFNISEDMIPVSGLTTEQPETAAPVTTMPVETPVVTAAVEPSEMPMPSETPVATSASGAVTIQVTDVKVTEDSITLQTNWKNAAPYEICFGLDFKIERLEGEAWKEIQTDEPIVIPAIACVIKPGGEGPHTYSCPKITGGVKAGTYRLVVNASHRDTQESTETDSWKSVTETLYGNFTISEDMIPFVKG